MIFLLALISLGCANNKQAYTTQEGVGKVNQALQDEWKRLGLTN